MYAILEIQGKTYKVSPGDYLSVDRLKDKEKSKKKFSSVVALKETEDDLKLGKPYVSKASVEALIYRHFRGKKILVLKKKRRKSYRKSRGHRQELSLLYIDQITGSSGKTFKAEVKKKKPVKKEVKAQTKAKSKPKKLASKTASKKQTKTKTKKLKN